MTIDTQEQAQAEARKRWGRYAFVQRYSEPEEFIVGHYYAEPRTIHGHSDDSWDAAFADADRKQTL